MIHDDKAFCETKVSPSCSLEHDDETPKEAEDMAFDDDFFENIQEGTRIMIQGNRVTFENMTPDLLDVAKALNPDDKKLKKRG